MPHPHTRIFARLLEYREISVLLAVAGFWIFFAALSPTMLSWETFTSVMRHAADRGIVAAGVAFLMIAGEFDLSVGSVYGLSALLFILVSEAHGPYAALAVVLASALTVGAANAALTVVVRIPSFIATLGTMWIVRTVIYVITGGEAVYVRDLESLGPVRYLYVDVGGGLPSSVIVMALVVGILHLVLVSTPFGNHVQAVGGAPNVARALGINVGKVKLVAFLIASTLAALGGLAHVARFKSVEAVTGRELSLEAIAASVIGGCSLYGGVGTVAGAALGTVVVSEVNVGLVQAGAPGYWYIGLVGALLIAAATINQLLEKRRR